jgi:hypothetical protein
MKCLGLVAAIALAVAAPAGARVADGSPDLRAANLKVVSTTTTFESCSLFVTFSIDCQLNPDALVDSVSTTLKWSRVPGADFYFVDVVNNGTIGSPGSVFGYVRVSADTMRYTVTSLSSPGSTIEYLVSACVEGGVFFGAGCVESNLISVVAPALPA